MPLYEYLLEFFPDYDYHRIAPNIDPERIKYHREDNITGHQQRAFTVYWCLQGAKQGGIGIDMGCGEVISPFCLGVDKFSGTHHPDYPTGDISHYHPHLVARADKPLPFNSDSFDFLVAHHALEHMTDTVWTLKEWIRIVKPKGILALILPDARYKGAFLDEDHKEFYTAKRFKEEVLSQVEELVEIIEWNTFQNEHSFNVVLKKRE